MYMNYLKWHNLWVMIGLSVSQHIIHLEPLGAWKVIKPLSYHNVHMSGFLKYILSVPLQNLASYVFICF